MIAKVWVLVVVVLCASVGGCRAAEVVTLGVGNFTEYVRAQRFVMVMFYAPWCSHSQTFAPQFDAIAATVDDPAVTFAKVDCVAEEGLYNSQKIEGLGGFPTLKAYMHGEVDDGGIHYTGERDRSELLAFVQRYTAQSYLDLDGPDGAALVRPGTDATPLEAFVDRYVTSPVAASSAAVLLVQEPLPASGLAALAVATAIDRFDLACKRAGTAACAIVKNAATPSTHVAVYRNFPEEEPVLTLDGAASGDVAMSSAEMVQFMQAGAYPNVVQFIEDNDALMFDERRPGYNTHVIFFLHGTADVATQQATFLAEMRALAAVHKTQAVFIHLNTADTSAYVRRIMEDVKISAVDAPAAMIIQSAQTKVQFFRYEAAAAAAAAPAAGVLDVDGVRTWVGGFFAGSLTPSRTERLEPYF